MRTWIFQGNPKTFPMDEYIAERRSILWSVNQRHLARLMAVGDRVYLWRAIGADRNRVRSGIVAAGSITEPPRLRDDDDWSLGKWTNVRRGLRLRAAIDLGAVGPVIHRDVLAADPILSGLRILSLHQETNYLVGDATQVARLEQLWASNLERT
jgi:hypothetical protein